MKENIVFLVSDPTNPLVHVLDVHETSLHPYKKSITSTFITVWYSGLGTSSPECENLIEENSPESERSQMSKYQKHMANSVVLDDDPQSIK